MSIRRYFDELKLRLVLDPTVESLEVISEKIEEKEGYLRVTIKLSGDSVMHCFQYVISDGSIGISKYSFHWHDAVGNLICRWDNAPHHIHTNDDVSASSEMGLIKVLSEVKAIIPDSRTYSYYDHKVYAGVRGGEIVVGA